MAVNKEREALYAAYSSKEWRRRVMNMSEAQVIAIYKRLKSQNKLKI